MRIYIYNDRTYTSYESAVAGTGLFFTSDASPELLHSKGITVKEVPDDSPMLMTLLTNDNEYVSVRYRTGPESYLRDIKDKPLTADTCFCCGSIRDAQGICTNEQCEARSFELWLEGTAQSLENPDLEDLEQKLQETPEPIPTEFIEELMARQREL